MSQRLITDLQFTIGGSALKLPPEINTPQAGPFAPIPPSATIIVAHGLFDHLQGPVRPTSVLPNCISPLAVVSVDRFVIVIDNPTTAPQEATFRCTREHSFQENAKLVDPGAPAVEPPFTQLLWQGLCGDFFGPTGPTGPFGGPTGPTGADSNVTGPTGPTGAASTVMGPTGSTGPVGASAQVWIVTPVQTSNYAASVGELVQCNNSAGTFTVTLPSAAGNAGKQIGTKVINDGNTLLPVVGTGGDTVDGGASFVANGQGTELGGYIYVSDGVSNWIVIAAHEFGGFVATNLVAVQTANYAASIGQYVRVDPSTGGFTVTLPAITSSAFGRVVFVKNVTASINVVTIAAAGGDTIDGAASTAISTAFGVVRLVADGVGNWLVS